jgi:hypothetical protein
MNPAETLPVDDDSAIRLFRSHISRDQPAKGIAYCDDRLHNLNISYWTDIAVTNDFAAQVISLYLQTDHPILGLFDPYLFIGDLITMKEQFCSRLLVHSLMYLACVSPEAPLNSRVPKLIVRKQMYSAFDRSVVKLSTQFSDEAKKLWEHENKSCSILNMAGAILLSLSLLGSGRDHVVVQYSTEATRMGISLGLFGDDTTLDTAEMDDDELRAHCYAAWGVFNWNM